MGALFLALIIDSNEGEKDANVPSLTRTGDIVIHGQCPLSYGDASKHGTFFKLLITVHR